jgi:PAS domain S-box-containing protein
VGEDILHIYDNPATCRFFGRAPGSSAGRLASELGAPPDAIREWVMHYREAQASGLPVRFEYRHAARDEHRYWLMVTVAVIGPGPSGRTRFAYVAEDITERRRAEKALRESEERLRAALTASGTGTYRWDMQTGAAQGDDAHTMLFGGPIRSDRDFVNRIHPEDRPNVVEMLRRCLEEGADFELDYRVLLPNGRARWLSDRGCAFRDNDGKPLYMTGAVIDITERKEAEARQSLLAAEVDHRAKNMLALVQVMLRQTRAATVKDYAAAALGRVAALGRAHTLLSESRWEGADLGKLMKEEIAPFCRTDSTRILLSGPAVALSPKAAQVFAMAVHELATNAAKHGALSVAQGRVSVDWSWRNDGRLALRWTEMGGPPVHAPVRRGLGMNVIERSIGQQLDGEVCFDWSPTGLVCELIVPARRLTTTAD